MLLAAAGTGVAGAIIDLNLLRVQPNAILFFFL
jgi:hypothetical protein